MSDTVFQTLVVSLVLSQLDYGNATPAVIPTYQHRRLQSVMNAAAQLIHRRGHSDHVTTHLRDLHWLKSPERVDFKLVITVYKSHHGLAPQYLVDNIQRIADTGRRHLHSPSTETLVIPYTRLVTAADHTFSSSSCRLWNSFPHDVIVASSLSTFRSHLETQLFTRSFSV